MNTKLNVNEMIEGFISDSILEEIKTLYKENKTLDSIIHGMGFDPEQHKDLMLSVKSKNEKRIGELYIQLNKKGVLVNEVLTHESE